MPSLPLSRRSTPFGIFGFMKTACCHRRNRGDGIREDVTENLRTVKTVPLVISDAPELLIVRGECLCRTMYLKRSTRNVK
jgi:NAD-dependent DNA ligase